MDGGEHLRRRLLWFGCDRLPALAVQGAEEIQSAAREILAAAREMSLTYCGMAQAIGTAVLREAVEDSLDAMPKQGQPAGPGPDGA